MSFPVAAVLLQGNNAAAEPTTSSDESMNVGGPATKLPSPIQTGQSDDMDTTVPDVSLGSGEQLRHIPVHNSE